MTLSDDLLGQARLLAEADERGRPKQVNLRRALSSAYYALFHGVTAEAARLAIPSASPAALHEAFARAFGHSGMKDACLTLQAAGDKQAAIRDWDAGVPEARFTGKGKEKDRPVPNASRVKLAAACGTDRSPALLLFCDAFLAAHKLREQADHSTTSRFSRRRVDALIESVDRGLAAVRSLQPTEAAALHLLLRTRDLRLG